MLSRVADSLYWMSRYLERAEHIARSIDVQLHLALDEAPANASIGWVCLLNGLRADLPMDICSDDRAATNALIFDRSNPSSIASCIDQARENARQIREQITTDIWEEINRLYLTVREMNSDRMWQTSPHPFLRTVQRGAQLLAGVADTTMAHGEGWQFIRLGRFLERTILLTWLVDAHFGMRPVCVEGEETADDFVAWSGLLRSCTAYEPYCKTHTIELRPRWILEFLLLNPVFPHSVQFSAQHIESALTCISDWTGTANTADVRRRAGRLTASLAFQTIDEILAGDLSEYLHSIISQCFEIHDSFYQQFIYYTVDAALRDRSAQQRVA